MLTARLLSKTALFLAALALLSLAVAHGRNARAENLAGGPGGTVSAADDTAFSLPAPALDAEYRDAFAAGRRLFRVSWRPRAFSEATADQVGLGPMFNRRSCAGCHVKNGRGQPPDAGDTGPARSMILRLGIQTAGAPAPHPVLGAQLQDQAVPGVEPEGRIGVTYRERPGQFADGTGFSLRVPTYAIIGATTDQSIWLSPRVPPAVFGGGLLEAVAPAALEALADPTDADGDGISGRLAVIDRPVGRTIGRFGWKATRATLRDQVIEAAAEDLGLASADRPLAGCTPAQAATIPACRQDKELDDRAIEQLVTYLRGLAAPARRNLDDPQVRRGETLFQEAGCDRCHRSSLATGDDPPLRGFGNQIIHPYTDLLLHDMGNGLADLAPDGAANGREWRTAPLWGIGLVPTVNGHRFFLHDGRARSVMEAVLWHGGEAAAARDTVLTWPARDRAALVAFLRSL